MEPLLATVEVLDPLVIDTSTPAANDDAPADSTISPLSRYCLIPQSCVQRHLDPDPNRKVPLLPTKDVPDPMYIEPLTPTRAQHQHTTHTYNTRIRCL